MDVNGSETKDGKQLTDGQRMAMGMQNVNRWRKK